MSKRIAFFALTILIVFAITACAQTTPTSTTLPPSPAAPPTTTNPPTKASTSAALADTIFYDGHILTMNPAQPTAQSIAIREDKILAVGSTDEIMAYLGDNTQIVDLAGLTITPGFIDSHAHRLGDRWHFGDVSAEEILDEALSQGWTGIHEMFVTDERLAELQAMADADDLPVRVSMYLTMNFEHDSTDWWRAYQPLQQFGPYLQITGLKITLDREWGEQIFFTPEQYTDLVLAGTQAGWQIATHSFSPAANAIALNGYEAALNGQSNDNLRLRLEHTGAMTDDEVRQMAELGVIGSVQLSAVSWVDDTSFKKYIPTEEVEHTARWRDMLDAGIFLIGNTDSPWCCTDWRNDFQRPPYQATAIRTLYQGVTRTDFGDRQPEPWQLDQTLTVQEALEMLTINGAYAAHQEDVIGSLEPGKFADLVILSANPLTIPVEKIPDIQVNMTMVGGKVRFCSEGQMDYCPQVKVVSPTHPPTSTEMADLIFHNGTILTMEDDQPAAQAIAIKGGIILTVGNEADVLAYNGPETQVIDLQGHVLQPGFIDPHTHVLTDMGGIEVGQVLALENGFTSVADASIEPGVEADFFDASKSGLLRLRTTLYLVRGDVCGNDVGAWYEQYPLDTTVGERVRIGGVKIFADGGACGKVAASQTFIEGYENGEPYFDLDTLTEMIRTADSAGYQVIIHAQGDLAIVEALDAYAAVLDGGPNVLRHRIEHNVFQTEQTIHRYSELGIVPTLFGSSEACRADLPWTDFYKKNGERPGEIIAANPGLVIAWHGDDPWQTPISPIGEYYGLVTRGRVEDDGTVCPPADWQKGAEVEREMALKMMTINAAYAIRQEQVVGSLAPGKYADLVILSDNLLSVPTDSIPDIQVLATIIGGQTEFCADPNGGYCPQAEAGASSTTETGSTSLNGNSASASTVSDPLENAFDGDPDTAWISGADAPQWVEVDLGQESAVSGIELTVGQYPNGYTVHRIYGRSEEGEYQLLHEFAGETQDGQVLTFSPQPTWENIRYIKIETTESPSWVAWKEIVVFSALP